MNKKKLKLIMLKKDDTTIKLAEYLGINRTTLSSKINEYRGAEFTQKEIQMIKERYELSADEIVAIFFDKKVSCQDT